MQHYLGRVENGAVLLGEEDLHHLVNVKRAELGEEIEISDGGKTFLCRVSALSPLRIDVLGEREDSRELDVEARLAFALLKGDHNEMIVQKGTELGVNVFSPFLSSRTIVKPQGATDGKWARLEKIARESAKQCRRANAPRLEPYARWGDIVSAPADLKFFAYEGEAIHGKAFGKALSEEMPLRGKSVLLLVGPEGGFSAEEAREALANGFRPVSLGKRILRAETAAIYMAGLLADAAEGGR